MKAYRVDGGVKVGGGHRPWGTDPTPDKSQAGVLRETEELIRERETCLSCSLPACNPDWANCPLKKKPRNPQKHRQGRKAIKVPDAFHELGPGPLTNVAIAEILGVSESTIRRWRTTLGYKRRTK